MNDGVRIRRSDDDAYFRVEFPEFASITVAGGNPSDIEQLQSDNACAYCDKRKVVVRTIRDCVESYASEVGPFGVRHAEAHLHDRFWSDLSQLAVILLSERGDENWSIQRESQAALQVYSKRKKHDQSNISVWT